MYDIDYILIMYKHMYIYIYIICIYIHMCQLFSKAPSWTAIAGGLVASVPGQAQVRLTKLLFSRE